MSDAVESVEIEDVLSSIRRLVSEEPTPRADTATDEDDQDRSEKLVLTAAFRVPDNTDDGAGDEMIGEELADAGGQDPVDAARQAYVDEVPEGLLATEDPDDALDQATVPEDADPVQDVAPDEPETFEAAPEFMVEEPEAAPTLEDRIAELEAAVSQSDEDWEPDGSEIDDVTIELSGQDMVEAEAETIAEPVDEPTAHADESASLFDAPPMGDEDILDEETLRELVGEIVRRELQGSLGERITRNVRKLVRQEINRALASRDFD